jgi:hypothetical protein
MSEIGSEMKSAYHVGDILESIAPKPKKGVIVAITLRVGQRSPKPNIFVQSLAKDQQLIATDYLNLPKKWRINGRIPGSLWQDKSGDWIKQVMRKEQMAHASMKKTKGIYPPLIASDAAYVLVIK